MEIEWEIKPKKFRDKRNGKIVTQFSILDIGYMEEIDESESEKNDD